MKRPGDKRELEAGAVGTIFRYPVKSMLGEVLDEAIIDEGGVLGDRAYALIDQDTCKVASAKTGIRLIKDRNLHFSLV